MVDIEATQEEMADAIYQAFQTSTNSDVRSQQAKDWQVGISDLGWCSERTRRMLAQEDPDDTDMMTAFLGTVIGVGAERAVQDHLWPQALIQPTVTLVLRGQEFTYTIPGHPDVILPEGVILDFKGLALDTPLPTPSGWTTMGEVRVGQHVFDRDGRMTTVTHKSQVKNIDCYRVTFRNGVEVVCDAEHRWAVLVNGREKVWSIEQIAKRKATGKPVSVPLAGTLQPSFGEVRLPIDPWVLGYWLGNGTRSTGQVTCHGDDQDDVTRLVRQAGWAIDFTVDKRGSNAATGTVKAAEGTGLAKALADAGLLGNKHIPAVYLRASTPERLMLLRGLMDSDGTWNRPRRRVSYTSTDESLARQVAELARTLGERVCISEVQRAGYGKTVTAWDVEWTPTVMPFACTRKADRVEFEKVKVHQHRIVKVEKIESVPTQCIAVSSPTHTYLCGEAMIPTHNTNDGLMIAERTGMDERQKKFQRHNYGLAAFEGDLFSPGVTLDDVLVGNVWIDRSGSEKRVLVRLEPYDPEVTRESLEWLDEVVYSFKHGETARKEPPREMCAKTCGFYTTCRAYDTDTTGLLTDPDVLIALDLYREGQQMASDGRKMQDQAKSALRDTEGFAIIDGQRLALRWVHINETMTGPSVRRAHDKITITTLP